MVQAQSQVGVEARFEGLEEFVKRLDEYSKRLNDAEKATEQYANKVSRSQKTAATDTESAVTSQMRSLRQLRWEIITILFYMRTLGIVVKEAWGAVEDSYNRILERTSTGALSTAYGADLNKIVASLQQVTEGTLSTAQSIGIANAAIIASQGQFTDQYASLWEAAEVIAVTAGEDVEKVFAKLVESIAKSDVNATQTAAKFYDLKGAVEAYAQAQGKAVDELSKAEVQSVLLNEVLAGTQVLLAAGADEAVENARALRELQGSWEIFTDVLLSVLGIGEDVGDLFKWLTERLTTASELIAIVGSKLAQFWAYASNVIGQLSSTLPGLFGELYFGTGQNIQFPTVDWDAAKDAGLEAFYEKFEKAANAMGRLGVETSESTERLTRWSDVVENAGRVTYDELQAAIDHVLKYEDIVARHNEKLAKIAERYAADVLKAEQTLRDAILRAENDYQRKIEDKIRVHESSLRRLYEREQQRREDGLAKHLLRLQQLRENYELRIIQSERQYQYERDRLVARGDVLGVDELDARYRLQQEVDKENYDLRVQQTKDSYALQQQAQRESLDQQVAYLEQKLNEQLQLLAERFQDSLNVAKEAYEEDMVQAADRRERALVEEAADFARGQQQWAEHWAKLVRMAKVNNEQVYQIMREYFGEGALLDSMMASYMDRRAYEVELIARLLDAVSTSVDTAYRQAFEFAQTWQSMFPGMTGGPSWTPSTPDQEGSFSMPNTPQPSVPMFWQGLPIPVIIKTESGQSQTTQMSDELLASILLGLAERLRGTVR